MVSRSEIVVYLCRIEFSYGRISPESFLCSHSYALGTMTRRRAEAKCGCWGRDGGEAMHCMICTRGMKREVRGSAYSMSIRIACAHDSRVYMLGVV